MKKIVLAFSATLFLSSLSVCAQEAPTTCCSEKKTEQAACAEKTPAQKEACASKPADGKKACCADKAATTPAASCGEHGAAKPAASCCADKAAAKPAEGCAEHGAAKPAEGTKACCAEKATAKPAEGCAEHGAAKPAASCCADKAAAKPAEGCAEHGAAKPAASCGEHGAAKPAASCGEHGAAKKESCAHGEGQVGKQCCGACQEGANQPKVVTSYRIQGGQVHGGEAPMHRMGEGTEMTVDTIVSGDSTKVIVRVMKRANMAEGPNLELRDGIYYLDGVELPAGAFSGEPHAFMFKGEGKGGSDMVWNEAAPGAGNAFFMASNKGTLGVKLEEQDARDAIKGAFVVEVIPASTAAALGLQANDIIVAVDGQSVTSEQSMMDRMADKKTGDAIEVAYRRDGKKKKASGFLIPTSPAMGLPMGGMMHGMPGMHMGEASMENVEITEEVGENGEKRVKVIVIKKDEN